MKKINFKKNFILTFVMILVFSSIPCPVGDVGSRRIEASTISGEAAVSNSENSVQKVKIELSSDSEYNLNPTYSGKAVENPTKDDFVISTVSSNSVDISDEVNLVYTWLDANDESVNNPAEAGNYTLKVELAENAKYQLAEGYELKVVIAEKEIEAEIKGTTTKVYDGGTEVRKTDTLDVGLIGVIEADADKVNVSADYKYVTSKTGKNLGIEAKISLYGESAKNYKLKSDTITKACGEITKADVVIDEVTMQKLQKLEVSCAAKLSMVTLPAGWSWENPGTILKCSDSPSKQVLVYTGDENHNSVKKTVTVTVKCAEKKIGAKSAKKNSAGNIAYFECSGCGRKYDAQGKELSDAEIVVPYFKKTIKVTVGKKQTIKRSDYMLNGTKAFESISVASKYKSFVSVNKKTGKITVKAIKAKNYKKLPQNGVVNVTVKYAGGRQQTIKVVLQIPAPKFKVTKKGTFYKGKECYFYTVDYNAPNATKVKVEVQKGGITDSARKSFNQLFKQHFIKNKGGGTVAVLKSSVTGKVKFKITVWYGKNTVKYITTVK